LLSSPFFFQKKFLKIFLKEFERKKNTEVAAAALAARKCVLSALHDCFIADCFPEHHVERKEKEE
jgi:hypothetical protein